MQLPDNTRASWKDCLAFWEIENASSLRMCPKLTNSHFHLELFNKMKVNLALQVLSHSTAAAMNTLVDIGKMPKSFRNTAFFIEKVC